MKRFNLYNPLHLLAVLLAICLLLACFGCANSEPLSIENVPDSVDVVINLNY